MGRKSIKENKTRFQLSRENAGFTREGAAATLEFISADRIEKIENEKTFPRPEEVIAMSESYNDITLCNYYCTHCCDIGQKYMPEIKTKELSQITLEMLATLNILTKQKDRLIERAARRVADALLEEFPPLSGVRVTCKKPDAPMKADFAFAAVSIYRERQ